jgi:hypothetical protein
MLERLIYKATSLYAHEMTLQEALHNNSSSSANSH